MLLYASKAFDRVNSSSSARLATPEAADRPCCNSVEFAYWSQARSQGGGGGLVGGVVRPPPPPLTAEGPHFGHPIDRINVVIGPIPFLALKITFNV